MRQYLQFFVFTVYCLCLAAGGAKNVLFVIVDDLRMVFDNDLHIQTPNLDGFRKNSVTFSNAFAQMALCAPSRNSLLTSRRPDTVRLFDFYSYWRSFSGNFTTLPQYLKNFGYDTYSIGKVFHPGESSNFTDDYPYSWSAPAWHPPTEIYKESPVCLSERGWNADLVCPVKLKEQPGKTLPDIESTTEAIRYLRERKNSKRPFFLALGYHKPHIPLKFPKEFLDFYPLESIKLPSVREKPKAMPIIAWNPWNDIRKRDDIQSLNISYPYGPISDIWAKRIRQSYFAATTYIDSLFGKVLNALKRYNLDEKTVVVFLGDHGWSLGEHGEWAKYSNFDVSVRTPVLFKIPQLTNGTQISDLIELVDIFPTLVEILGLPALHNCGNNQQQDLCTEGKSILPLILGEKVPAGNAFSQYPRPGLEPTEHPNTDRPRLNEIHYMGYSIRSHKHRYTIWTSWRNFIPDWSNITAVELYDHTVDPEENNNIANRVKNIALKNQMHKKLIERFQI